MTNRVYISLAIMPVWIAVVAGATAYFMPPFYGLATFVAFPVFKVGITKAGRLKQRNKEISDSTPGFVFTVLTLRHRNAFQVEQTIHNRLSWLNVRWFGNGKTEYFATIALPIAIFMLLWARFWWAILILIFLSIMILC